MSNTSIEAKRHSSSSDQGSISKNRICSEKTPLLENYGGLGCRFYERLGEDLDRIFQVDVQCTLTETRGSVRDRSVQLAIEMNSRGIREQDIIVLCSKNNADQVIVLLASLYLGAIVAALDPEFTKKQKQDLLKKLKPKMCFADTRMSLHIQKILSSLSYNSEVISFNPESSELMAFAKLCRPKEYESFRPLFISDTKTTVAFIVPTQGTTDTPKLVCLSHDSIWLQAVILEDILEGIDRIISFFPLSWILQIILVCTSLEYSFTLIIPGTFSTKTACKIIRNFDIGYAILGTDLAMKLAESVSVHNYNLSCLQSIIIGIVDTSKNDIAELRDKLPDVKFLTIYCMVETGLIAAVKTSEYFTFLVKPPHSVGSLTYNCRIKVFNISTKELCGPNEYGEIYFRGDGFMLGYFKDKELTENSLEKGYFKTGDYGKFDETGWIYISGRIEDLINSDKWSLFPTDVEETIALHERVKQVAVIGNDKEVIAIVKKDPDSELSPLEIGTFISKKLPQKYWPDQIIIIESFPKTSMGAIKKNALKQEYLNSHIRLSSSLDMSFKEDV